MIKDIVLPEISENVATGEVAKILVQVGDMVTKDQSVVEVETDKAVVEVPSPFAGKVVEVPIKVGAKVAIGGVLVKVETEPATTDKGEEAKPEPPPPPPPPVKKEVVAKEPVAPTPAAPPPPQPIVAIQHIAMANPLPMNITDPVSANPAPAAPSVRGFARNLGVDINKVPGSGPGGRISLDDVKRYVQEQMSKPAQPVYAGITERPLPDFTRWGTVDRQPMSKIRQITAEGLAYSWTTIPHVTQCESADMTELEEFRKRHQPTVATAGGKLTVTVLMVKIVTEALRKFPQFNASLDMTSKEIVYKRFYNIGIAVDTDRGLLVPVIKGAEKKTLSELAVEIAELADRARTKKITPDEMDGGTFTITNLGALGGTHFTPIIYPPQVAILGLARSAIQPIWQEGQWVPKLILPMGLSYDHRIIDGADGARFIRFIAESIEHPMRMFL